MLKAPSGALESTGGDGVHHLCREEITAGKTRRDHWDNQARQWNSLGPPLRPGPGDVRLIEALVEESFEAMRGVPLQALLLGVTPELACMGWPHGTKLLAVDRCLGMIRDVWPRDCLALPALSVCGEWRVLPISDGVVHVVVGDGCYPLLDSPGGYQAMGKELRRVLKPAGRLIMRFFVRPERAESPAAVFSDLRGNRISNFHIFKLRLAMSLQGSLEAGVRLGDVWERWRTEGLDADILSRQLNWPRTEIATIDAYRGVDTRYAFPTLQEMRAGLAEHFVELACHVPDCEPGKYFPTLVMKPRG